MLSFRNVTYEEIVNEIKCLDPSKSTQSEGILGILVLQKFNKYIIDGKFPDQLKIADFSPITKKVNHNNKTNY